MSGVMGEAESERACATARSEMNFFDQQYNPARASKMFFKMTQ